MTEIHIFRSEETADLLLEKSQVAEKETMLLTQKANEAEQECQRVRMFSVKTQDEKTMLETKVSRTIFFEMRNDDILFFFSLENLNCFYNEWLKKVNEELKKQKC